MNYKKKKNKIISFVYFHVLNYFLLRLTLQREKREFDYFREFDLIFADVFPADNPHFWDRTWCSCKGNIIYVIYRRRDESLKQNFIIKKTTKKLLFFNEFFCVYCCMVNRVTILSLSSMTDCYWNWKLRTSSSRLQTTRAVKSAHETAPSCIYVFRFRFLPKSPV